MFQEAGKEAQSSNKSKSSKRMELIDLPRLIFFQILYFLSHQDRNSLRKVSLRYSSVIKEEWTKRKLWIHLNLPSRLSESGITKLTRFLRRTGCWIYIRHIKLTGLFPVSNHFLFWLHGFRGISSLIIESKLQHGQTLNLLNAFNSNEECSNDCLTGDGCTRNWGKRVEYIRIQSLNIILQRFLYGSLDEKMFKM